MQFNEKNEPVLNKHEDAAAAARDMLRTNGVDDRESAREALAVMGGRKTKGFVEWLSKGTLSLDHGEVVEVEAEDPETVDA